MLRNWHSNPFPRAEILPNLVDTVANARTLDVTIAILGIVGTYGAVLLTLVGG